ncbi:MAG: ABC transporter substrate-binding protein [Gaiellaceae bacterium]|jgi:ABC-type transport system substrate-binding protein
MSKRHLSSSVLVVGLSLVLIVAAASAGQRTLKELTIETPAFDYIDPALVSDPVLSATCGACTIAMWAVQDATCAMLFRYPVGTPPIVDADLVPEVAAGFPKLSRDGTTYTFTVRKGFRFSTGAPLTAANYVRAFRRVLTPAMNSPAARYLQEVSDVKADGDHLVVQLTKKVPDFPARMTMPYLCPVPPDLPVNPEGVGAPLPGSGPFYVAEFIRNSRVLLKRNPFYGGTRPHHVDQLVIRVDADPTVTSHKVETGDVDVDLYVPPAVVDPLVAKFGVNKGRLSFIRGFDMFYTFMNTQSPLFKNNRKLRQAVNFALDRTAMLRVYGTRDGSRSDSYLPRGLPGYRDVHPYPVKYPNLAKARAHAAGNTRSGKAVMLVSDRLQCTCRAHAETVQYDLSKIGIDVQLKFFPTAIRDAKVATRGEPFDLANFRVSVDWVDPYQYVNLLLDGRTIQPTGNTDYSYFNSPHYNRLMDRAAQLSGQARYDAYGKLALDIERNEAPMATYIQQNRRFFVSSRVGCVRGTGAASHGLDLAGLCLK